MPAAPSDPAVAGRAASGGLVLAPFRGVRYSAAFVPDLATVIAPPYDVIDTRTRRMLEDADPYNLVRLILPRSGYDEAGQTLRTWQKQGVLLADERPALYLYEQQGVAPDEPGEPTSLQRGLIGALALRDPEDRVVLPHEGTMPQPVEDRLALMQATEANFEPILLVYDGGGPAAEVVDEVAVTQPLAEAVTEDGVRHRLWGVTDATHLAQVADDIAPRQALIADGHHRYATYRRLQAARRRAGEGDGPWDHGLAMLVDSARYPVHVAAIHRLVRGLDPALAVEQAAARFRVRPLGKLSSRDDLAGVLARVSAADAAGPALVVVGDGRAHLLERPEPGALRGFSAAVLDAVLIEQTWQIAPDDPRVRYVHDPVAAVRRARDEHATAVLLAPVPLTTVREVAATGGRMPRKSTSFGPKPRSGLVLRTFAAG